jgi:hypothetical protein
MNEENEEKEIRRGKGKGDAIVKGKRKEGGSTSTMKEKNTLIII